MLFLSQVAQDSTQKRIHTWPLQDEKFTTSVVNKPTDFYVLDGVRMESNKSFPNNIEITQVLRIKDPDALRQMGVIQTDRSFTFYNTESNYIYVGLFEKVKPQVPLALWGMKLPFLLNKKLILSHDFTELSKIDHRRIEKIVFLPKSSPAIKANTSIVYGAIQLQMRD